MGNLDRRDASLFILVFAVLLVREFFSPPIWHHGEAREALVVQGIIHNHQWILPLRNGELPSKPPLFHWLAALPALLFGTNDFTVRLPSVIGAEVMAIATFLLARGVGGRRVGWLAVGALLGMSEFWDAATEARVDMVFSACIAVALVGFYFWFRDRNQSARTICYMATACAVLAKGPAGIALIGLVMVSFLAIERQLRLIGSFWSWPLVIAVLVVDFGWYALAYQTAGNEFLAVQLQRENLDRALGTGEFDDHQNLLALAGWFVTRLLPWNLALLWSLIRRLRGAREDSAGRLLHAWWISIALIFAFAAGKRAIYLLPLYPAIAVLAARAVDEIMTRSARFSTGASRPLRRRAAAIAIGAGLVAIDSVMMIISNDVWKNVKSRRARLSVVDRVKTFVPSNAALFATPEVEDAELIVIAYRLGREVERKLLMCARGNDYFLSPIDSGAMPGVDQQIHVASESENVFLIHVSSGKPGEIDPRCITMPAQQR